MNLSVEQLAATFRERGEPLSLAADRIIKECITGKALLDLNQDEYAELTRGLPLGARSQLRIWMESARSIPIYPASDSVILRAVGSNGTVVTGTTKNQPNLLSLPDGRIDVEWQCVLNTHDGPSVIESGKFRVEKQGSAFSPSFIDLALSNYSQGFYHGDAPMADADVSGTVETDREHYDIVGKTDDKGFFSVTLSRGTVTSTVKKGRAVAESVAVVQPRAPATTAEEADAKSTVMNVVSDNATTLIVPGLFLRDRTVYLGDVSGSMSARGQMDRLRRAFRDRIQEHAGKRQVSFAVWNTGTNWWRQPGKGSLYVSTSDVGALDEWVRTLDASGGNDMRQAIEEACHQLRDINEIVVLCDGDIAPFSVSEWDNFRKSHPTIIFSFVAIGDKADYDHMRKMAGIGNGTFLHVK